MKKVVKKAAAILCMLCMTLTMQSCGSSPTDTKTSSAGWTQNNPGSYTENVPGSSSQITNKGVFFTYNGEKYYRNGRALLHMVDDNTSEYVKIYDADKLADTSVPDRMKEYYEKTGEQYDPKESLLDVGVYHDYVCLFDGSDLYEPMWDSGVLCHYRFVAPNMVEEERLYEAEDIKPLVKRLMEQYPSFHNEDSLAFNLLHELVCPQDGGDGFIYASVHDSNPLKSRLVRYAKDGSLYEIVDGVYASDLVINDGWLYCYDSGYTWDVKAEKASFDDKRRGIYKMKPDGSEKTKLTGVYEDTKPQDNDILKGIAGMSVVGESLYYVQMNSDDLYYLYKLDLNGGTPEKVSDNSCYTYCIDTQNQMLYFWGTDEPNKKGFLAERNLSDGTERVICNWNYLRQPNDCRIQLDGDYLYISGLNYMGRIVEIEGKEAKKKDGTYVMVTEPEYQVYKECLSGQRVNIKTGKEDRMFYYSLVHMEMDSLGIERVSYSEPWKVVWKSVDEIDQTLKQIAEKYDLATDGI